MRRIACVLLGLLISISTIAAETDPNRVQDFTGAADVTSNPDAVVLTFKANGGFTKTSDTVVFVMQHTTGREVPPAWSGKAQLFLADGLVAIIGEDGTKWMFRFAKRPTPESLRGVQFKQFEIYGSARYGEDAPLTAEQIDYLKRTGQFCCKTDRGPA